MKKTATLKLVSVDIKTCLLGVYTWTCVTAKVIQVRRIQHTRKKTNKDPLFLLSV